MGTTVFLFLLPPYTLSKVRVHAEHCTKLLGDHRSFHQYPIPSLEILLLIDYFLGKFCEAVKLPAISGYILGIRYRDHQRPDGPKCQENNRNRTRTDRSYHRRRVLCGQDKADGAQYTNPHFSQITINSKEWGF
jgi:hypothetical protein